MDNTFFITMLGFIAIIWFLMIAPQRKREKERQRMIDNLKVDDQIVTLGGLHGYIEEIGNETLLVEIADGVVVEIMKNAVAMVREPENAEDETEALIEAETKDD
jgi:preprotein translocase subunit YajC